MENTHFVCITCTDYQPVYVAFHRPSIHRNVIQTPALRHVWYRRCAPPARPGSGQGHLTFCSRGEEHTEGSEERCLTFANIFLHPYDSPPAPFAWLMREHLGWRPAVIRC